MGSAFFNSFGNCKINKAWITCTMLAVYYTRVVDDTVPRSVGVFRRQIGLLEKTAFRRLTTIIISWYFNTYLCDVKRPQQGPTMKSDYRCFFASFPVGIGIYVRACMCAFARAMIYSNLIPIEPTVQLASLPPTVYIVAVVVIVTTTSPRRLYNNKTTDCVIKTTSINHKCSAYTGRPTKKKKK